MGFSTAMVVVTLVSMVMMVAEGTSLDTLQPVSYSGWKVLEVQLGAAAERVTTANSPSIDLNELDDAASVHVLTQNRRTGTAEVAVSPSALSRITQHLDTHGAPYTTIINDLGRRIKEEEPNLRAEGELRGDLTLTRYMTYDEIKTHVERLQGQHPGQVKVEVAGRSVEGRPIHLVTLTDDVANAYRARKPVVFIDGGIHAREWVSPAAVLGVMDNLLKTPSLTAGIEWRIIPLVNPDGYVASWQKDRLWRKNTAKASGSRCVGVDLNRNFGYHWGEAGSSGRACSTIYRGPHAFSEPEAKAVRDAVLRESSRTKAYVTFHSYGQMILHPWGYTSNVKRENNNKLESVGNGMARAIKKANRVDYSVGSAAGILYAAAGGSDDWAAGVANIPLVYTIELRDKGSGGFILPSNQIKPTVDDAWLAMKTLGEEVLGSGTTSTGARPASYPQRQASEGPVEEGETQEPVEGNQEAVQGDQTPGRRNEAHTNTNQELIHIIQAGETADQEPSNRNEGQEDLNQGQENVNRAEENINQEPVNRNEGQGSLNQGNQAEENINQEPINRNEEQENLYQGEEGINETPNNRNQAEETVNQTPNIKNEGQGTLNQGTDIRNQEPVIRNQEQGDLNQATDNRDQEPVIRNREQGDLNQATDNRDQEPVIRNQEQGDLNQATDNRDQEPVIRNQEQGDLNQATDNRDQEPVIRNREQGDLNQATDIRNQGEGDQDSFEAFDSETETEGDSSDSSFETISSSPSFSSGSVVRAAFEPHVEPLRSSESLYGPQETLGGGVPWEVLRGGGKGSSEEEAV